MSLRTPRHARTDRTVRLRPGRCLDEHAHTCARRTSGRRKEPDMLLTDKVAVVYGAGGAIGGAVARAFAGEGATVFLTGREQAAVDTAAQEIAAAGGSASAAQVDALEEEAIDGDLDSVISERGPPG